jgi:hypothetical protein
MLSRQWQLGEFEGEDSGSPIYVKVENRHDKISSIIQKKLGNLESREFEYDDNIPLEVFVERVKPEIATRATNGEIRSQLDLQMQVRLGLQFQKEMDMVLRDFLLDPDVVRRFKRFLAQDQALRFELNDDLDEYESEPIKEFVSMVKGRVINIYRATNLNSTDTLMDRTLKYFINNPVSIPNLTPSQIGEAMQIAFENLKNWWHGNRTPTDPVNREESFFERPPDNFSFWNPKQLEYDFKVQISSKDASKKLILDASNYKEDHLEWYSFTVAPESTEDFELPLESELEPRPSEPPPPDPIASNLRFAGMPEKRWWNFEDNYVDFGSINPKKNNIASILLMEFALVHSPDWYIIPYQMTVGTINKIEKLAVVDCFGDEALIEPAGHTKSELDMIAKADKSWDSWGMFTLSEKYKDKDRQHYTPYFLLPPTLDYVLAGTPLEEVKMLRDETANLVWAVEMMYRSMYGVPVSGYDRAVLLQRKIKEALSAQERDKEPGKELDKPLKYTLMTNVPWNWIPFIPVNAQDGTTLPLDPLQKQIELQRASMINPVNGDPIRPNSRLLNEVQPSYYIDEVEVPRNGIIVSENFQRSIWHTGDIFLWIGRKRHYGAGEDSSGLKFDSIPLKKKL